MPLSSTQISTEQLIANYGAAHGYNDKQIEVAIRTAFLESSLGTMLTGPAGTTSHGIFGYNDLGWANHVSLGSRDVPLNSIAAFYADMTTFEGRYATGRANGTIPASITQDEYIYIKHHDGPNYSNFANAPGKALWNNSTYKPDLTITSAADWANAPGTSTWTFNITDPIYYTTGFHWFTNNDYVPQGTVTVGPLQPAPTGDGDGD